jgi:hypothetical protein
MGQLVLMKSSGTKAVSRSKRAIVPTAGSAEDMMQQLIEIILLVASKLKNLFFSKQQTE